MQVAIYNSDFEVTIGGLPTLEYFQANYDYVEFGSSNSSYSVTIDDDTTAGGFNAGMSHLRTTIAAPNVTVLATNFAHEIFNGNPNSPTSDALAFNPSGLGDTFTATLAAGGTALDGTMRDSQNVAYSNAANDCLLQNGAYGSGPSTANFIDDSGDATINFGVSAGLTTVTSSASPNLLLKIINFTTITASVASSVENNGDVANLYDTSGNDTFTATGGTSTQDNSAGLSGSGISYAVNGFYQVNAYSVNGGTDNAVLTDSTGNGTFKGTPAYSFIANGNVYQDTAYYFATVQATSATGGQSTAIFEASGTSGTAYSYNPSTYTLDNIASNSTVAATGFASYSTNFTANDAPVLNEPSVLVGSIPEGTTSSSDAGELVSTLINGQPGAIITDPNGFSLLGIAVTGVDNSNGTWEYSVDEGDDWASMGNPTQTSALLLSANGNTLVRFVPTSSSFAGTATFTFVAWDETSNSANVTYTPTGAYSQTSATATISVTTPVSLSGTALSPNYPPGGAQVEIYSNLAITDSNPGATGLTGATLQIIDGYSTGDTLNYSSQNGISGTYSNGTLILSSRTPLPLSTYEAAIQSVTFTSNSSTFGARTIALTVTDGTDNSAAINGSVMVFSPITLTAAAPQPIYTYGVVNGQASPELVTTSLVITDTNASELTSATITISSGFSPGDTLQSAFPGDISQSYDSSNGTLYLTGPASFNDYELAIESTSFWTDSNIPSPGPRTVTFDVSDGTYNATMSFTFSVEVPPPTVSMASAPLVYGENSGAVAVDPSLTVSDVNGNLTPTGATVTIGGYVQGNDSLTFTGEYGITGTFSNGVLALSGTASLSDYQSVLDSVVFTDTGSDSNTSRSISVVVTMGQVATVPAQRAIDIEFPLTVSPGSPPSTYTIGGPYVVIFPNLAMTDLDSATLTSATISITGNAAAGDSLLYEGNDANILANYNAQSYTLSLASSVPLSIREYESAIQDIEFEVDGATGGTAIRTIQVTVSDGTYTSVPVSEQLSVLPNPFTVTLSTDSLTYVASSGAVPLDPNVTLGDPSGATIGWATVELANDQPEDSLSLSTDVLDQLAQYGIGIFTPYGSAPYDGSSGVLGLYTVSGTPTVSDYQWALQNVTYQDSNPLPNTELRYLQFSVGAPGGIGSFGGSMTVQILVPPTVALSSDSLTYTEESGPTVLDPAIVLADSQSQTLVGATISISSGYAGAEDLLEFTAPTGSDIQGSYSNGILTLSGTDTLANYENALASVTYQDSSPLPNDADRTISISITDGMEVSSLVTETVGVVPNNYPISAPTDSQEISENSSIAFSSAGGNAITLSDDGTTLSDQLTLSAANGTLTFTSTAGLSFISGSNGTSSIIVTGTLADLNAALNGLLFTSTPGYSGNASIQISSSWTSSTDGQQFATTALTIPVSSEAGQGSPAAVALVANGPTTIQESGTAEINLTSVFSGAGQVTDWTIDWGDGSSDTEDGASASHEYTSGTGTYTVTATADTTLGSIQCPNSIAIGVLPSAPTGLSASAAGGTGGQVDLSWTDESEIATGYRIEQSTDGANYSLVATVGEGTEDWTVDGLTANTQYYFRVCAVDDAGRSSYASADATTNSIPTGTVPGNDDLSSSLVGLGMNLNFYGVQFSQVYVNK